MTVLRRTGSVAAPFYGRTEELGALRRVLGKVAGDHVERPLDAERHQVGGHLDTVLVEGEAGIGKTRLVDELLDDAAARAFLVLRGSAHELEWAHPFGALTEALGLADASDPRRARIGELLTTPVEQPAGVPVIDVGFRITEAVLELLQELATQSPLVLVLEDLHWADPSTVAALGSIGRRLADLPLLLIATLRPSPHNAQLQRLMDTFARQRATHVSLTALSEYDVTALAGSLAGAPVGPRLQDEVSAAGGNPLFVIELVQALLQEGVIEVAGGQAEARAATLPSTLRRTVLRRLATLPPEAIDLLRVAAVLGPCFPVRDLAAVHGRTTVELLPLLEEPLRAGILGDAGDELSFPHELIRAAIYEDLPAGVRKQLHREVAGSLMDAQAPAVRVAEHLALGVSPGDADADAVAWLRRAGLEAAPRSATIAVDLLERALELAGDDHPHRAALQAELAPLLVLAGQLDSAEATANKVLDSGSDVRLEVRLRVGLAHVLVRRGRWRSAREQIERAAACVPDPDRTLVLAPGSYINAVRGDMTSAAEEAAGVLAVTEGTDSPIARSTAMGTLALVADARGFLSDGIHAGRRAVAEAARASALFSGFLFPELNLGMLLMDADDLDEAGDVLLEGLERAGQTGGVSLLPYYHGVRAWWRFPSGEWDDALTEADAALAVGADVGICWVLSPSAVIARIAVARGDLTAAERAIEAVRDELTGPGAVFGAQLVRWAEALFLEASGADGDAVASAMRLAWDALPELRLSSGMWAMALDVARVASQAGDDELVTRVTEEVEAFAERAATASARGAALRCRGMACSDAALLLDAVAAYDDSPRPIERAWAMEDAASVLAGEDRLDEARPLFGEALAFYEGVGATPEVARTLATMRAAGLRPGARGRRQRPATGWASLTPTENKVSSLVAEGLTNQQIASRLYVSRHTVESHLKHIFAKLGVSARAELAAGVARRQVERGPLAAPRAREHPR